MGMKFLTGRGALAARQSKKRFTLEDTLNAKPVRNETVKEKKWDDGQTFLVIPRKDARWVRIFSRIFYIPEERKISLDEIGAWVWSKCDGRISVNGMIDELAGKFNLKRKEAEVSLLKYLKNLGEKRLIGFVIRK
jgi:hypothetical protein